MTGHLTGSAGLLAHRTVCEAAIRASSQSGSISPARLTQLRRELGAELAAFVVTQLNLQHRASKKLQPTSAPTRVWWCTDRSLQQATPWQVAKLKANWFGESPAYDLCCGIGGDANHLAARGPLVAVDADPLVAELAAMNLGTNRVGDSSSAIDPATELTAHERSVRCADVTSISVPPQHLIHIDPDRRPGSKRTSRPDHYQPSWEFVVRLLRQQAGAVVKLAPAAHPELEECPAAHRCWISLVGSVREQTMLTGETLQHAGFVPHGRSAVIIRSQGDADRFHVGEGGEVASIECSDKPLDWLVDPDAAIRAAGLTEAFGEANGMSLIGRPSGFLTCTDQPDTRGLAQCSAVIWAGSCDDRKLRRELRQRNAYPEVVKVRGTDHQPETLQRKYRKCGETPVQLWIGRGRDRVFAALTERQHIPIT
ncbi:MAG: class I SAM-dependent methyltransferase [Rubripirellula sp.]